MLRHIKKTRVHHTPFILGFIAIIFVLVVFIIRSLSFYRIGSNIYVDGISLEGMNYQIASEVVESHFKKLIDQPTKIKLEDKTYEFETKSLGFEFDTVKTIENVYLADYGETLWDGVRAQFFGMFQETHIDPVIHADIKQFKATLEDGIPEIKPVKDAGVNRSENGKFEAIEHVEGLEAKYDPAYKSILASLREFKVPTIELETEVINPVINKETALEAVENANHYTSEPYVLFYTGEKDYLYELKLDAEWVKFENLESGKIEVKIDREKLANYINENISAEIDRPNTNAVLKALPIEGSDYAEVEGITKDGLLVLIDETIDQFEEAIREDQHEIELVVEKLPGKVVNETGQDLGELKLLATGKSNWEGSPNGRDFNVRRGLNEKVNNIFLVPGGEYDFNKNLGLVTKSAGWKDSLAIFRGSELIPVPGGGLCQVSTTVYRAAINAGLPIVERSNHSLYVHYYKEYGDGLDAAIYPGQKNLRFTNDTGNFMLIQAYDDGYDGIVNVYGTPDNRDVELIGPFYPKSIDKEWKGKIKLNSNQIGWWQIVRDEKGNVTREGQLTASYRSIPY